MDGTATRFVLIVTVAIFAAANVVAQQEPSADSPDLQPNAGGEESAVKRVVEGVMQPYVAQRQRMAGGHRWTRSPHLERSWRFRCTAIATSFHMERLPTGALRSRAKPSWRSAPAPRHSPRRCSPWPSTATKSSLTLPLRNTCPAATGLRAQQLTPLELADFTSGMPDDPTNLPRGLEQRSIESYTVKDFLTWASNCKPRTQLPAPYKYLNAGIGLLSYLVATARGKTWEDQVNSEILQPLGMVDTTLRPTPEQQKRLAEGHNRAGQDAPRWPVFAWYAAGGLRSTAHDMVSFGEAYLGHKEVNGKPISAEMIAAMQLAEKPIFTMPNGNSRRWPG
jgi:Beta-lactamase